MCVGRGGVDGMAVVVLCVHGASLWHKGYVQLGVWW
jgi:hypothetical protein